MIFNNLNKSVWDQFTDTYGEGGGKGGGGGGVESPDTIATNETVKILHLLSDGQRNLYTGDGRSIFLNGTPFVNADTSNNFGTPIWEFRNGSPSQTIMSTPAFPGASQIFSVGQQVLGGSSSPFVAAAPVIDSVTSALVDYANVTIQLPNGLVQVDGNGNIIGDSVEIAIDVKPHSSSTWVNAIDRFITGKASSEIRQQYEVHNPSPGADGYPCSALNF